MGIKARVEAGENVHLSQSKDIVWFLGIVLSGILICILVFTGHGIFQSIIIPSIFSSFWLLTLLLFKPIPLYSICLFVVMSGYFVSIIKTRPGEN